MKFSFLASFQNSSDDDATFTKEIAMESRDHLQSLFLSSSSKKLLNENNNGNMMVMDNNNKNNNELTIPEGDEENGDC